MANLGSLIVELSANTAKLQSDLGKAAAIAEARAREIDKSFNVVKTGLASIGIGFAVGATFDAIKSKIEGVITSAAGLQQLSERTGATVEALSGLVGIAKLSGTDTEALATGLQKLSKSMIDAENGGKKTSAAFEAIGISTSELAGKRPEQVFQMVSKALAGFEDGAEKVVIAQTLLGKAGANLLPVMNDLAAAGDLQVKVTAEQAAQADELEKNQLRLRASTDAVFKKIGLELIPVFDAFTKALLETQNANDGVRKAVGDLAADGSIRSWAEGAAKAAAFVIDAFDGVVRVVQIVGKGIGATAAAAVSIVSGEFSQAGTIMKEFGADADAIMNRTLFSSRLQKQLEDNRKTAAAVEPRKKIDASGLGNDNDKSYKGPKDDPAKKELEGRLKAQEDFIAAEKTLLSTREQYIDHFRNLEYYTLRESEEKKQELIAVGLARTEAAYDEEVAAINRYLAKTGILDKERQDGQNKLAEVSRKRAAAEAEASKKITDSQLKIDEVKERFNLATAETARQQARANDEAQFQIDLMGKSTLEVEKAIAARKIQADLEERIFQLKKQDPNVDTSKAIADAAIQQAKATALIEQGYLKQRDAIFGASEALRKYAEDATNAGAQVENAVTGSLKSLEDTLVDFVTKGKADFKSLANSIIADLARIAVKQTITGPLSSALGGLLGGGFNVGLANLMPGDSLDNFLSLSGNFARAAGGPVSGGSTYLVGEHGPELFTAGSSGTIIPNDALQGGGGQAINIVINNTVGDVATLSQLKEAQAGTERRIAGMIGRSQRYGGALA